MNNLFFSINLSKKEIYLFNLTSDQIDAERNLITRFSFDQVIYMIEEYILGDFHSEMENLLNLMMEKINIGNEQNQIIAEIYESLKIKHSQNALMLIFLSILFKKYQFEKNHLFHMNILKCAVDGFTCYFTNNSKNNVTNKYNELTKSMDTLVDFCKNNFKNLPERVMVRLNGGAVDINKREIYHLYSVDDSLDAFIYIFLSNLYIGNLKVYTCNNCHKRYFCEKDAKYCPNLDCQKAKEKEIRRKERVNRRNNPYKSLADTFNTFVRQKKYNLKLKDVSANIMSFFEKEKKTCLYNVKMEISTYQDSERPIDDDLISYIDEQKSRIKELYDSLSKQKGTEQ